MENINSVQEDSLILVDDHDNVIGPCSKTLSHQAHGSLHRAFSVFLVNNQGQFLLQKRSINKKLWPMCWSNSCCSHPKFNEDMQAAVIRRLDEELGVTDCSPHFFYKFKYFAPYNQYWSEREYCHVYMGLYNGEISLNEDEIRSACWYSADSIDKLLLSECLEYTPWFRMEWQHIRVHLPQVYALIGLS